MPRPSSATSSRRPRAIGFGFQPDESSHHFVVDFRPGNGDVLISEHHRWEPDRDPPTSDVGAGREDAQPRVLLKRSKWDSFAEEVRRVFNQQLKRAGLPSGRWTGERVPLSRSLGKELVLLAWAVEDAELARVPRAIANWSGLKPEERWWMYTMTRAATGHAFDGRNRGWRVAVRYALTENPAVELDGTSIQTQAEEVEK